MSVNPYESPQPDESLPIIAREQRPLWLEILYLAITAISFFLLVPAVIVFIILLFVRFSGEDIKI
jgi:hypothetical protein